MMYQFRKMPGKRGKRQIILKGSFRYRNRRANHDDILWRIFSGIDVRLMPMLSLKLYQDPIAFQQDRSIFLARQSPSVHRFMVLLLYLPKQRTGNKLSLSDGIRL
jgi:hypothetical protein